MKKFVCCLIVLIGFSLVVPMGFASPCTDECQADFNACGDQMPSLIYWHCGNIPVDDFAYQVCLYDLYLYWVDTCEMPYYNCIDSCE